MPQPARTILVIDDTDATRYALRRALTMGGHATVEVGDGGSGLRLAAERLPDLITLDVNLPDMSGFDVCRALKSDEVTCHIPVLMVTASAVGADSKVEGLDGGADAYLMHPVDPSELLATIRALLRAADAESELRQLVEAMPQKVWTADAGGARLRHNGVWRAYSGLTEAESRGDGWQRALHPDDRAGVAEGWRASVESGRPFEMAYRYRRADGAYRWHLGRAQPALDRGGRAARWFGTCTDVDDARRALDALAVSNEALQAATHEAEAARGAADEARGAADEANKAKSDFLAMMSHELRTPLNAIGGYSQLIAAGIAGPTTERQLDYLGRMGQANVHLLALINDVLNFAKLESGHVHFEVAAVPVASICSSLDAMLAPQVAARGLTYTCDPVPNGLVVRADAEKMLQVLINLTTNAMKFTPSGGSVSVHTEADEARVSITVSDTGRGIPADKLATVFEPFVQAHRFNGMRTDGVGLGLAISRDLARAMGGDLTAESAVGEGSAFTLTLPRAS